MTTPQAPLAPPSAPGPSAEEKAALHRIVYYSVAAGLCPLIPIPLVDDVALAMMRRQMAKKQFANRGLVLSDAGAKELYGKAFDFGDKALGCLTKVVVWPIKKLFKKIFFFLSIKECVDVTSEILHQGWLLEFALRRGFIGASEIGSGQLVRIGQVIKQTCDQTDTRPINMLLRRAFTESKRLLTTAAMSSTATIKREVASKGAPDAREQVVSVMEQGSSPEMGGLVEKVEQMLWLERGYIAQLEQRFEQNLKTPPQLGPKSGS